MQAAFELYAERGFEQTTVAEIAERAGLTERTFFRHFSDKREVLFAGADELTGRLVDAVEAAPTEAGPIEAAAAGLAAAGMMIQEGGELPGKRQAIINASPELQERELIKLAALTASLADALRGRGIAEPAASLSAQAAMAVFRVSFERWAQDPDCEELPEVIRGSLNELRALTAAS